MVRTAQNKIFIFREGEKVQIEAYGAYYSGKSFKRRNRKS